jgi:calcineurin-like phosphoesterase family protein
MLGNHDEEARIRLSCPSVVSVQNYLLLKHGKHHFVLFHYPIDDWDGRWRGSIHLHAHTHSNALRSPNLPYMTNEIRNGHDTLAEN